QGRRRSVLRAGLSRPHLISMESSLVSAVMVYFKPDVSGSWYFAGREKGWGFRSSVADGPPDPCGASVTPTFTSPGTTSVMMYVPSVWIDAAEYEPSGPTNLRIPDRSGWPLYETVPRTVTFFTPLPVQPATATTATVSRARRRPE